MTIPYGTILIAEDDTLLREVVHELLEMENYSVLSTANGDEALETFALHKERITMALLDIVMPIHSGIEVAKQLLNDRPDMPIVFATGHDNGELTVHRQISNKHTVIRKPYNMDLLLKVIHSHIQQARQSA